MIFIAIVLCGARANASPMLESIHHHLGLEFTNVFALYVALSSNRLIARSHINSVVTGTLLSASNARVHSRRSRSLSVIPPYLERQPLADKTG